MNISVVGLGKLGLPFAFFLASHGHKVYGIDKDYEISEKIKKNYINVETNLNFYINKYNKNFIFEKNVDKIIKKTKITFLVLPTPSKKDGSFSSTFIINFLQKLSNSLIKKKGKNHLIVITSTVSPGSCEEIFIPYLKKRGLIDGKDFSLVYNPHFIAQGTTLKNLENPDFVLIGTNHKKTEKKINKFYNSIYNNRKLLKNTNLKEGEITKISINSYITSKISFSNYISEICENTSTADAKVVLDVIGSDKRINKLYLKVGTKFSGPCFPRDNLALKNFSEKIKVKSLIPKTNDKINSFQSNRIIKILKKITNKEKILNFGIMGLTYKTDTNLIQSSQGDSLLRSLKKNNIKFNKIFIFDKYLKKKQVENYDKNIFFVQNLKEFFKKSKIICIMYKDESIKINYKKLAFEKKYIIDTWRNYEKLPKPYVLISMGKKNKFN